MQQCPFCKIASKEIPADIVYEDESTIAFLDANPSAPGHTLVIPKRHIPTILDADNETLGKIFETVKTVTEMIKKALQPDGFSIGINQGQVSGQRVPHLHIHIIPRFKGDKGAMVQMVVRNPPKESLVVIKEKIRAQKEEEVPEYILEEIKEKTKEIKNVGEKLEKYEKEEEKKEYKGKKIKDKEEDELEEYEKILRQMMIPK